MRSLLVASVAALVCFFPPLSAKAEIVSFADGTFDDSDWTAQLGFVNATSANFTAQQSVSGGNPDGYREVEHEWTGPGGLNVLHLNSDAIYNPSVSGSIAEIDYSFDLNWLNAPNGPGGVAYSLLLFQNDTYYAANQQLISQNNWFGFGESALSASDFTRHQDTGSGGVNPDFSASGSLLQFGYLSSNGTSTNPTFTTRSGIDNWSVNVQRVTEPSSCVLLFVIALGIHIRDQALYCQATCFE